MKLPKLLRKSIAILAIALTVQSICFAQAWPTASTQAKDMLIGWNIGNSLEVPGNETGWGNPATTQQLIDAVKAAGFNTIRIPCAWDSYADQSTLIISATWLARVAEVVDYCFNNNMYVILNSHWDNGWLENHPTYDYQVAVNKKQKAYWTQIANYFKSYGPKLLFAGTNEVHANYGTPTQEHIEVQESYNQTFVDAVRATGGNNTNRNLVVQFYNTNYWHGLNYFSIPKDEVSGHLFVEAHHYDPYNFTLNEDINAACIVWGSPWSDGDVCPWGQEDYTDDLFGQIKSRFVNKGFPVIMGEYGVIKRTGLSGNDLKDHLASRLYYLKYITAKAKENGILPIYWDNGWKGENGFALFDRNSGTIVDKDALDALMEGVDGGGPTVTYTLTTNVNGSGTITLNPAGGVYDNGTLVTLTATPSSGYIFSGWSGVLSGTTNPATLTMNSNLSVTATFTEKQNGKPCDNPTKVSIAFVQEGAGEFCFVTSDDISHVNSWSMDVLEINGQDYANKWSNSLPDKIDGNYFIYYKGSHDWSHFDAAAVKNAPLANTIRTNVQLYPNPFNETINILIDNPDQVERIAVMDQLGRIVKLIDKSSMKFEMKFGDGLESGLYIVQVFDQQSIQNFTIHKK